MGLVILLCALAGQAEPAADEFKAGNRSMDRKHAHVTTESVVRDVANHQAFEGFGPLLLPWDDNARYFDTPLHNVGSLMPYHNNVDPGVVVGAINHLIDEANKGQTVFYDFYAERQQREDPAKESTGLFFFRGKPGAPFAVICPGGGFSYVGSLHEGFPLAVALSQKGYNAFVLRYRVGGGLKAAQDLAAAVSHIFEKAKILAVGVEGYSLWGGSAGGRMVGDIALHGTAYFGGPRSSQAGRRGHRLYRP